MFLTFVCSFELFFDFFISFSDDPSTSGSTDANGQESGAIAKESEFKKNNFFWIMLKFFMFAQAG